MNLKEILGSWREAQCYRGTAVLLPVFNYPVLVSLLHAIAHHQHCMVHILTVAIFIIVYTYETNRG